jgi:UPF0716 protein FxsA
MLGRLLLLFVGVPCLELALLMALGRWLGIVFTLGLIVGTGIVGAWMAKRQGLAVLREIRRELEEGRLPAKGLLDGVLLLLAAALLLTPGVLTDIVGLALLLPATRHRLRLWLRRQLERRLEQGTWFF